MAEQLFDTVGKTPEQVRKQWRASVKELAAKGALGSDQSGAAVEQLKEVNAAYNTYMRGQSAAKEAAASQASAGASARAEKPRASTSSANWSRSSTTTGSSTAYTSRRSNIPNFGGTNANWGRVRPVMTPRSDFAELHRLMTHPLFTDPALRNFSQAREVVANKIDIILTRNPNYLQNSHIAVSLLVNGLNHSGEKSVDKVTERLLKANPEAREVFAAVVQAQLQASLLRNAMFVAVPTVAFAEPAATRSNNGPSSRPQAQRSARL